jgi:hypothetical protein
VTRREQLLHGGKAKKKRKSCYASAVATVRRCRVSVTGADGITHTVEVAGTTLFHVAAAAVAQLRDEGWSDALTPNATLRVEVQIPPIVHDVPLKALERWAAGPNISPKEAVLKKHFQGTATGDRRDGAYKPKSNSKAE